MISSISPRRSTLENRASRLGLVFSKAERQAVMHALNNHETAPRWQLSDGKHLSTVRYYCTLAEVAGALDWAEVEAEFNSP